MRPASAWAVKPKCVCEDKIKRRCLEPCPSSASYRVGVWQGLGWDLCSEKSRAQKWLLSAGSK